MKFFFLIGLILFSLNSFGVPCGGAPGKNHKNPDGSVGGFVADTASSASTATIDSTSSVCERAVIQGNAKVRSGSQISGSAVIEGNSNVSSSSIKGMARVLGNSSVTNSKICQASEINFNVTNSEYYCMTDDEEPKDPGELGKKNLLGIDSDMDGVRDDVEIWINNSTSNSPSKYMYNVRMALKQIARNLQESLKIKVHQALTRKARIEALYSLECLKSLNEKRSDDLYGELRVLIYNTMDRLKAWARTEASLNGFAGIHERKKYCEFSLKK